MAVVAREWQRTLPSSPAYRKVGRSNSASKRHVVWSIPVTAPAPKLRHSWPEGAQLTLPQGTLEHCAHPAGIDLKSVRPAQAWAAPAPRLHFAPGRWRMYVQGKKINPVSEYVFRIIMKPEVVFLVAPTGRCKGALPECCCWDTTPADACLDVEVLCRPVSCGATCSSAIER